jgi:hypothetical protein
MPSSTIRADARVRAVPWRDLPALTWAEKSWELVLPLPWLAGSFASYASGHWILGAVCSFYFFLTGLRQSHGAQRGRCVNRLGYSMFFHAEHHLFPAVPPVTCRVSPSGWTPPRGERPGSRS